MNRKLPVWEIFTRGLSLLWEKRGFAAAIGWPVILLSGLFGLSLDLGGFTWPIGGVSREAGENPPANFAGMGQWAMIYVGVQWFLLAIVAVYWHRNILLQETQPPVVPIRADGPLWRYIGYALLIALVVVVFALVVPFLAGLFKAVFSEGLVTPDMDANVAGALAVVVAIIYGVAILTFIFRVSLTLPAAAVSHKGFGLRSAWRATRGNSARLVGLQVLAILFGACVMLVELGAVQLMSAAFGAPPLWFRLGLGAITNFVYVLLGIGLLSLTYAYLIYDMPPEDARMEA